MEEKEEKPFYGFPIHRASEQEIIDEILKKHQKEEVDETLKKKVWEELQKAKYEGEISIPFRVVIRKDTSGKYPPCIEVILDTRL